MRPLAKGEKLEIAIGKLVDSFQRGAPLQTNVYQLTTLVPDLVLRTESIVTQPRQTG